jgi:hypothetical protein
VVVETRPAAWVEFLTGSPEERRRWLAETRVEGTPGQIEVFAQTLGRQEPTAARAADPQRNQPSDHAASAFT